MGTGRLLSVTLYLDATYQAPQESTPKTEHGGSLRVYPFPPGDPIDVEPYFGRMVLFSACNTYHRVMPSERDSNRLCLSMMFYGHDNQETSPLVGTTSGIQYSLSFPNILPSFENIRSTRLMQLRSVLTPLLYFEEFRNSLRDAFLDYRSSRALTDTAYISEDNSASETGETPDSEAYLTVTRAVDYFAFKCRRAVCEDPVTKAALAEYLSCFPEHASRLLPLLSPPPVHEQTT